jgi:hypothetical protein
MDSLKITTTLSLNICPPQKGGFLFDPQPQEVDFLLLTE